MRARDVGTSCTNQDLRSRFVPEFFVQTLFGTRLAGKGTARVRKVLARIGSFVLASVCIVGRRSTGLL